MPVADVVDCSENYFSKAVAVMPGGVSSPVRAFMGLGIIPPILHSAFEDQWTCVNGNRYIDYCGSWGALINGHAHPQIIDAVTEAAEKGTSYGLTSLKEIEFAEYIVSLLPFVDKVRFAASGTEAAMTAIRMARAYTGKRLVVKFQGHYHGHSDVLSEQAGSFLLHKKGSGTFSSESEIVVLPYNDFEVFSSFMSERGDSVAGVIFEPVSANMGVVLPKPGFLKHVTDSNRNYGIVTIADEVVTGFRLGLLGARSCYDFTSDLTLFGKIIGGGLPVAAIGGKAEFMDVLMPLGNVFHAGTFSGNPLGASAGMANLMLCSEPDFYESLEKKTNRFLEPIENFIVERDLPVRVVRKGSMFCFRFTSKNVSNFAGVEQCDAGLFKDFFLKMYEKGVYLSPSVFETGFVSSAHSDFNLDYTVEVVRTSLDELFF
ncbi:MAG: glutamate-1-semialdehyde 2,1-aminomutase [Victivallaceae bacterium]